MPIKNAIEAATATLASGLGTAATDTFTRIVAEILVDVEAKAGAGTSVRRDLPLVPGDDRNRVAVRMVKRKLEDLGFQVEINRSTMRMEISWRDALLRLVDPGVV